MPSASEPLLIATRSEHKFAEIRAILPARVRSCIVSLLDAGVEVSSAEDQIESFDTFADNALAKAEYFRALTGLATIADDSGLVVTALQGEPGVRSKRFSQRGDLQARALDEANNTALLAALADVPDERRGAHYVCAAALVRDGASAVTFGSVTGRILRSPRGSGGFGYDPLFFHPGLGRAFGEIDRTQKHALSHRGRAFRALAPLL
jgi:XTP/dITP diphosphohydrolase